MGCPKVSRRIVCNNDVIDFAVILNGFHTFVIKLLLQHQCSGRTLCERDFVEDLPRHSVLKTFKFFEDIFSFRTGSGYLVVIL